MGKVQYLVIHCTATPEGRVVTADDIRRWHTSPAPAGRGWKQVGYTDMIMLDGRTQRIAENNDDENIDLWEVTNGCKGINSISRHLVYVGGLSHDGRARDTRTMAQKQALEKYVRDFVARFPHVRVAGHNQFAAKACPSFSVPDWLDSIGLGKYKYSPA